MSYTYGELKTLWYEGLGDDVGSKVTNFEFLSSFDAALSTIASAAPIEMTPMLQSSYQGYNGTQVYLDTTKGVEITVPADFMAFSALRITTSAGTFDTRLVDIGTFFETHDTDQDPICCLLGNVIVVNKPHSLMAVDPVLIYKKFPALNSGSSPANTDEPDIDDLWRHPVMRHAVAYTFIRHGQYDDAGEVLKSLAEELGSIMANKPRDTTR